MIDPIAVGLTKEITSRHDKGENKTTWIIGAIDSIQRTLIQAEFMDLDTTKEKTEVVQRKPYFLMDLLVVAHGLKGFRNFGTVEFRTEKKQLFDRSVDIVPEEIIKQIPLEVIQELSNLIWAGNHVDKDLEKN